MALAKPRLCPAVLQREGAPLCPRHPVWLSIDWCTGDWGGSVPAHPVRQQFVLHRTAEHRNLPLLQEPRAVRHRCMAPATAGRALLGALAPRKRHTALAVCETADTCCCAARGVTRRTSHAASSSSLLGVPGSQFGDDAHRAVGWCVLFFRSFRSGNETSLPRAERVTILF